MQVARRYARALYEEAERHSKTERVDEDMELIRESLAQSRELVGFFRSPVIGREKKEKVVRELFKEHVDSLTLRFLTLLVSKRREDVFPDLVRAYREMRDRLLGVQVAKARTATALADGERQELSGTLERMTGQRIRLETEVDPKLIGGIVVRIGDTVYDGSVRHHLENLREQLKGGSFRMN